MEKVDILENRAEWQATYRDVWLKHYQETGETKWKVYNRPNNQTAPGLPGIDLGKSKLVLITSAGSYLRDSQPPFDHANDLGDYSIRLYPFSTAFDQLAYAHDHFDHTAVNADPQVLIPLRHLEALQQAGKIGELGETVISFMGYQPDAAQVVDETIPQIVKAVKDQHADAALLVPS